MMAATPTTDPVRLRQEAYYDAAEASRFEWLTRNPIVRDAEKALLSHLGALEGSPAILEVGCGEGANLATLLAAGSSFRYTGFDCFHPKVAFCRRMHSDGRFLVADARQPFPFIDASYDRVLVRDLLHHLAGPDREHVLRESMRVLAPGGRLLLIEGNAANLVGRGFAMLFAHERCMLETRTPHLQRFVANILGDHPIAETMAEPSNLFRLICHYQFGFPVLGRSRFFGRMHNFWSSLSRAWRPRRRWAYSIIEVRK